MINWLNGDIGGAKTNVAGKQEGGVTGIQGREESPVFKVSCVSADFKVYGAMGAVRITPAGTSSLIFCRTVLQMD